MTFYFDYLCKAIESKAYLGEAITDEGLTGKIATLENAGFLTEAESDELLRMLATDP